MNSRTRLTDAQKTQLEENFVVQLQQCYNIQTQGVKEAVAFFQELSMGDKRKFDWHALDRSIEHHSYPTKSYSYKYINETVASKYADKWPQEDKDAARVMAQNEMAELQQYLHARGIQMTPTDMRRQVIDTVYARVSQNPAVHQCPKKVLVDMLRHFLSDEAVKTTIAPAAIPVLEFSESDVLFNIREQPQLVEKLQVQELQLIAFINLEASSRNNETYIDFFD
ncbi:Hypothetical_protein [Hexamita inflata]|uniref:Hypothetical_protein n=1 Tax=Hexamita inflata TaxID=28002 RepID=A0AA86R0V6_9EUKA|nr:Hypothetical protein HINF_LOCUS55213 [Hexamita inflata]